MNTFKGVILLQVLLLASRADALSPRIPDGQDGTSPISLVAKINNHVTNDVTAVASRFSSVAPKLKDNNSHDLQEKASNAVAIGTASVPMTTVTEAPDVMDNNDTAQLGSTRVPAFNDTTDEIAGADNETTQQPEATEVSHHGVDFIDPIDHAFMNHLFLEGHVFGRESDLQIALYSSLSYDGYFQPQQYSLSVRAVSMSYMRTEDGREITDVLYVVTYGGYVIERFHVQRILSKPEVHRHLHHNLESNSLKEYGGSAMKREESWARKHMVALAVGGAVVGIMILVFVAAIVTKRKPRLAGRKKSPVGKGPCVNPSDVTDKRKLFATDDSGIHNPAYNINSSSVMDGELCP